MNFIVYLYRYKLPIVRVDICVTKDLERLKNKVKYLTLYGRSNGATR